MHCINCGNKQSNGKFCAACGSALGNEVIEIKQTRGKRIVKSDNQLNESIGKVKVVTNLYWMYFLNYLKHPSEAFEQDEKEFVKGIVNTLIMAIIMGISYFILLQHVPLPFLEFSYELSFFSVMRGSILFVLVSMVIVTGSLFLTTLFLAPDKSFKSIVSIYGTHLIPSTFLASIALLLLLMRVYFFANFLLSFALLLAFLIVPLYILTTVLKKGDTVLDPLYCVVVYTVITGIAFSALLIIF